MRFHFFNMDKIEADVNFAYQSFGTEKVRMF